MNPEEITKRMIEAGRLALAVPRAFNDALSAQDAPMLTNEYRRLGKPGWPTANNEIPSDPEMVTIRSEIATMNLTVDWDACPEGKLAVTLRWNSHEARLEASTYDDLAKMVGRQILGCLDEPEDAARPD